MCAVARTVEERIDRAVVESVGAREVRVPTAREMYLTASTPSDDATQDALESKFFEWIKLRNGTYKYTYSRRLDDLNELVQELLPPARPLKIMDVAVSSGVSTFEWTESLERAGIEHHMTAGDLTVNTFLLSVGKRLNVLVDNEGRPLQYDVFGRVSPHPPGGRYRARYLLPLTLLKTALSKLFPRLRAACLESGARASSLGVSCHPIQLVSPRLKTTSHLDVIEDDILSNTGLDKRFHVLRAANILNKIYFDEQTLRKMLLSLRRRLMTGGLFIVCRTNERNQNNGTVFELNEGGRFETLARIGEGSEIEGLVLSLPPAS
jgi:hypothetical protein